MVLGACGSVVEVWGPCWGEPLLCSNARLEHGLNVSGTAAHCPKAVSENSGDAQHGVNDAIGVVLPLSQCWRAKVTTGPPLASARAGFSICFQALLGCHTRRGIFPARSSDQLVEGAGATTPIECTQLFGT